MSPAAICKTVSQLAILCLLGLLLPVRVHAADLVTFDFTRADTVAKWRPLHDTKPLTATPQGLRIDITGGDPYIAGPASNLPAQEKLWLEIKLWSETGGGGQVFYFRDRTTEEDSVRFTVPPGRWVTRRIPLPPQGPGTRLRIDPPGSHGYCLIERITLSARTEYAAPAWQSPDTSTQQHPVSLTSGDLELLHAANRFNDFELKIAGHSFARGYAHPQIGWLENGSPRWTPINEQARVRVEHNRNTLQSKAQFTDSGGALWQLEQIFTPTNDSALTVTIRVTVDRDRDTIFLPLLTLLPGTGSFGTNKTQALLSGVEYLSNEASSSEADVRGPGARRLVPDALKITFPVMAVAAQDHWLSLSWTMQPEVAAVFDSPDRQFHSDGHLLGLIFPGSHGDGRDEGSLLPLDAKRLRAGETLVVHALISSGRGTTIVPAVQDYVHRHGLPALPTAMSATEYSQQAAHGWLHTPLREGDKFRHAVWSHFTPMPAADAALYLSWLTSRVQDPALKKELRAAIPETLKAVPPAQWLSSGVSHVRMPVVPLLFGHVAENRESARQQARAELNRLSAAGTIDYSPRPDGPDYASTHFARHASGLSGQIVAHALQMAVFSGDQELIDRAVASVRALAKTYSHDIPRGAQTWEVPLHTPDILASAHLVKALCLAYEVTHDQTLLEEARYWAWTGVPFIYLRNPTAQPIGPYSTTPVLGATGWVAPLWIGLPVQWCGMVYADALNTLAEQDSTGPWKQLADGISITGTHISWPTSDAEHGGLLPDVYHLAEQERDGPAINPGTVESGAAHYYAGVPLYAFRGFPASGLNVHAAGQIKKLKDTPKEAIFTVQPWSDQPTRVLINRLPSGAKIQANTTSTTSETGPDFNVLTLTGPTEITVRLP